MFFSRLLKLALAQTQIVIQFHLFESFCSDNVLGQFFYLASYGFAIQSNITTAYFSSKNPCSSISRKGVVVIAANKMNCSTSG
jgi:hypothetical protein